MATARPVCVHVRACACLQLFVNCHLITLTTTKQRGCGTVQWAQWHCRMNDDIDGEDCGCGVSTVTLERICIICTGALQCMHIIHVVLPHIDGHMSTHMICIIHVGYHVYILLQCICIIHAVCQAALYQWSHFIAY